ncbi:glycosyltransferase [Sphingomonas sp. ASY06-1R]|uniref:glycosyltransferase n=1 Tax=Sphingomonas sp. ASY06-1R TaxID=3445771 RepID=UPI003FA324DA
MIARCLSTMLPERENAPFDIIVVCNGCTDNTADIARGYSRRVKVIELEQGSKTLALNTGIRAAVHYPLIFVDADISVGYSSLCAVAAALRHPGAMTAAPAIIVDTSLSDWIVRNYYKIWLQQPYVCDAMVGSGVYGLSEEGLAVIGQFPAIIADDGFVRSRFDTSQRVTVKTDLDGKPASFTVYPPRGFGELIRIESRRRAGDAQLRTLFPSAETARSTKMATVAAAEAPFIAKVSYGFIKIAGRLRFQWNRVRRHHRRWERDDSSR